MLRWRSNSSLPPPHPVKQRAVLSYAYVYGIRTFVETGTYLGQMVASVKDEFATIASIELSRELTAYNRQQFKGYNHISILEGDSSSALPTLLAALTEPCLFWLDAHYSAGITAMGDSSTPVMEELRAILSNSVREHIVLIDDARCFTGENGYPVLDEIRLEVETSRPDLSLSVSDDIVRIVPRQQSIQAKHQSVGRESSYHAYLGATLG